MNTLGKIILVDYFVWILVAIFMHPVLTQYGISNESISNTFGVNVDNEGNITVDTNTLVSETPQPNVGTVLSNMQFFVNVLAIKDWIVRFGQTALTPVYLLFLPDAVIPAPIKIFFLVPMVMIGFFGIIALIRGWVI